MSRLTASQDDDDDDEFEGDDPSAGLPEFSSRELFTDCTGAHRAFDIEIHLIRHHGYSGFAREVTTRGDGGYMFRTFTVASLPLALARLRQRVRAGIALRYLIPGDGAGAQMPFERLRGRIEAGGVVVDGKLIEWDEFNRLLESHEGWEFDLRIPSEPDW